MSESLYQYISRITNDGNSPIIEFGALTETKTEKSKCNQVFKFASNGDGAGGKGGEEEVTTGTTKTCTFHVGPQKKTLIAGKCKIITPENIADDLNRKITAQVRILGHDRNAIKRFYKFCRAKVKERQQLNPTLDVTLVYDDSDYNYEDWLELVLTLAEASCGVVRMACDDAIDLRRAIFLTREVNATAEAWRAIREAREDIDESEEKVDAIKLEEA